MKRVIVTEKDIETVNIDSIDNYSIIGISENLKHYVIKVKNGYCASTDNDITNKWVKDTQKEYIQEFCKRVPESQIFIFDTHKELFKWLSD